MKTTEGKKEEEGTPKGTRAEWDGWNPCLRASRVPTGRAARAAQWDSLTQMSCFSPIGKFEYKSTISGVLYMGVVFLVI